jgi:hypothetical protein
MMPWRCALSEFHHEGTPARDRDRRLESRGCETIREGEGKTVKHSSALFELSKKRSRAGRLGGKARAAAMTKKERHEIAIKASRAAAEKRRGAAGKP